MGTSGRARDLEILKVLKTTLLKIEPEKTPAMLHLKRILAHRIKALEDEIKRETVRLRLPKKM